MDTEYLSGDKVEENILKLLQFLDPVSPDLYRGVAESERGSQGYMTGMPPPVQVSVDAWDRFHLREEARG